jgi:hypothetical protein
MAYFILTLLPCLLRGSKICLAYRVSLETCAKHLSNAMELAYTGFVENFEKAEKSNFCVIFSYVKQFSSIP